MRGLAAGPGAMPVADEPLRGQVHDDLEVGMIIIDDEDDNDEDKVTEAEEPSSSAGQEPAHAGGLRLTPIHPREGGGPRIGIEIWPASRRMSHRKTPSERIPI